MKSRTFALAMVLLVSLVGCSDDDDPVVPASTGTIVIDLQPEGIEAPWQLAAPNYLTHSGTGEAIFVDMPLGCYTVTWFHMVGWDTPNEETLALTGDDVLTLTGNYVSRFVYIPPGTFMMGSPEKRAWARYRQGNSARGHFSIP